jgi:hypothetical protein
MVLNERRGPHPHQTNAADEAEKEISMLGTIVAATGAAIAAGGAAIYKLAEERSSMTMLFLEQYPNPVPVPPLGATEKAFDDAIDLAKAQVEIVGQFEPDTESEKQAVESLLRTRSERVDEIRYQRVLSEALRPGVAQRAADLLPAQAALIEEQKKINEEARSQSPAGWSDQFARDVQARLLPLEVRCRVASEAVDRINLAVPRHLGREADRAGALARKLAAEAEAARTRHVEFTIRPTHATYQEPESFASKVASGMKLKLEERRLEREAKWARHAADRAAQDEAKARAAVEEARQRLLKGVKP